jgi:ubiquinone/menaquinone biosynthesis C-methylase UbiE
VDKAAPDVSLTPVSPPTELCKKTRQKEVRCGVEEGIGPINPGDIVIDVCSGAGFDALIASRKVGPQGRVIGIDMTAEMLAKARAGAKVMGAHNVEFVEGYADELPLPDDFADVLISNGVLNLTPNKEKTLRDWARVLTPGGRLFIGDILISKRCPKRHWMTYFKGPVELRVVCRRQDY